MALMVNTKQKILILGGLVFLLTLAYASYRYIPANQVLQQQASQLQADKQELAAPKYPEVPDDDPEELKAEADALAEEVLALQTAMQAHLDGLSNGHDQDLILRISEIARANGVKVTENVAYAVTKAQPAAPNSGANPAAVAPAMTKAERKRQRREQLAAAGAASAQNAGEPPGTLIYQLVNSMNEPRPMQAMTLEGKFFDLKGFLQALSSMPTQITVVRIEVVAKTDVAVQGMPQGLQVKMILAM